MLKSLAPVRWLPSFVMPTGHSSRVHSYVLSFQSMANTWATKIPVKMVQLVWAQAEHSPTLDSSASFLERGSLAYNVYICLTTGRVLALGSYLDYPCQLTMSTIFGPTLSMNPSVPSTSNCTLQRHIARPIVVSGPSRLGHLPYQHY